MQNLNGKIDYSNLIYRYYSGDSTNLVWSLI